MNQSFSALLVAALGVVLAGCPTGYRFKRVTHEPPQVTPDLMTSVNRSAEAARRECGDGIRPVLHCSLDSSLCNRDLLSEREVPCNELKPLFSFIHLSDMQLKEHQVALDGPISTESYDGIIGGASRHAQLERNDDAVLLATVLGINYLTSGRQTRGVEGGDCVRWLPPKFAIHTGDSVDAGMFSELFQVLTITNELEIPFYNVVGNHDNLFFGTLPKDKMRGLDVTLPFVPIGSTERFINAHNPRHYQFDIEIPYVAAKNQSATERGQSWKPGTMPPPAGPFDLPKSDYRGFDLICADRRESRAKICPEARGYYAFDTKFDGGSLRMVVLNTAEVTSPGVTGSLLRRSRGELSAAQLAWLRGELASLAKTGGRALVFGHHNLDGFVGGQDGQVRDMLSAVPGVLAYVTGHTHINAIHHYKRPGAPPLWEIVGGSTLVYPQLAQIIELTEDQRNGALYLRVRSFRQGLSEAPCARSTPPNALAARARAGWSGALKDRYGDSDWRPVKVATASSNGLLLVAPDKKEGH